MYCLLYDVPSQKRRNQIIRICKDHGFMRIQKSCFWGAPSKHMLSRMEGLLQQIAQPEDCICLIPVPEAKLKQVKSWGQPLDVSIMEGKNVCFV